MLTLCVCVHGIHLLSEKLPHGLSVGSVRAGTSTAVKIGKLNSGMAENGLIIQVAVVPCHSKRLAVIRKTAMCYFSSVGRASDR